MATAIEVPPDMSGIREWMEVLDSEYRLGAPVSQAASMLPTTYAHVQRSSALGRWMYQVSLDVDQATLEVHSYNLLDLCRLAGSEIQLSSPFGRWMQQMSRSLI